MLFIKDWANRKTMSQWHDIINVDKDGIDIYRIGLAVKAIGRRAAPVVPDNPKVMSSVAQAVTSQWKENFCPIRTTNLVTRRNTMLF